MSAQRISAWFLGPKAENAEWERQMILHILEDYFHWRRNYFPSDEILVAESMRRNASDFHDRLAQQVNEMLAGLRAHFPFYSPRYNAHMLSDQTIPSVLGYFAGLLYNPNNVTPESSPVTLRWEFEVGADILRMLGYTLPPTAGHTTKEEFGWAHITGGGTVANLEALWVARNVRYFPLVVRHVCRKHQIPLTLKLPRDPETPLSIADIPPEACLGIRPNQAIYLYGRFVDAVRRHWNLGHSEAVGRAHDMLSESEFNLAQHGPRAAYRVRPPALLVSGARHYSISRSADVLGIGRQNVILVDVDSMFRLDVRALDAALRRVVKDGLLPLAVITIAGTTEMGAVDPVDRVAELREETGRSLGESFWLHVDAAWGGYLRTLFTGGKAEAGDVGEFVSRELTIQRGRYSKNLQLKWGAPEVCQALLGFSRAESITVDPHKMGYVPYPCGAIAYKNDLVRQFVTEEIPYIAALHSENPDMRRHRGPEAVGPYILEGSKPGSSVAACWLSHRMIPPERSGYGEIMRASLLAACEFYERLVHWDAAARANGESPNWRFLPISTHPPDTNIVSFLVQERPARDLAYTNSVNQRIYESFTIGTSGGEPAYSYMQEFFLSRTVFEPSNYSFAAIGGLLDRAGIDPGEYRCHGLFVLRATVMSPYHSLAAETSHRQALLAEFVEKLAAKAAETVATPANRR